MLSPEASIKWHPFSIRNVLGDQLDERDTEDAGEELIEGEEEDLEEGESRTRPCEILKRRRLQYESRRIKALLSEHGGEAAYRICHLKRCKLIAPSDGEDGGGSPGDLERTGIRDASKEPDVDACASSAEPEVDVENVGTLDLTSDDDEDDESAACRRNYEGDAKDDDDVTNQPGLLS